MNGFKLVIMNISSNFDSGNIEVVSIETPNDIQLNIPKDTNSGFFQWFYFRATGVKEKTCIYKIINAKDAAYPEGWDDYNVAASYDRVSWFRVPTKYVNGELVFEHQASNNAIYYAYFAPFTYEQHLDLVDFVSEFEIANHESLGQTIEGREIDFFTIGTPSVNKKKIWIIARQHPGESMAEWFMQGMLSRLLDASDPVSRTLLEKAVFYIVPNLNIDGSIAGNLRTNTLGVNYNREWGNPDKEKAPEVFYTLEKMKSSGVDLNLDVHGDEGLAYNFISGIEGIPSFDENLKYLSEKFLDTWVKYSPDMQKDEGYPKNEPGKANLNICSKAIGERFKCLSQTLEMPFKDNANLPDPLSGWSPERSELLGTSVLNVILEIVDEL